MSIPTVVIVPQDPSLLEKNEDKENQDCDGNSSDESSENLNLSPKKDINSSGPESGPPLYLGKRRVIDKECYSSAAATEKNEEDDDLVTIKSYRVLESKGIVWHSSASDETDLHEYSIESDEGSNMLSSSSLCSLSSSLLGIEWPPSLLGIEWPPSLCISSDDENQSYMYLAFSDLSSGNNHFDDDLLSVFLSAMPPDIYSTSDDGSKTLQYIHYGSEDDGSPHPTSLPSYNADNI
jgi:hypothetical protein